VNKAEKLFKLFGGIAPLARLLGLDDGGVSRWSKDHEKGNHGRVPPKYNRALVWLKDVLRINPSEFSECLDWGCPCCGQDLRRVPEEHPFWHQVPGDIEDRLQAWRDRGRG
jgi:hypothetical protein